MWDSEEKQREKVEEPIPEGAGSIIRCCADSERYRWLVTDSHIVRFPFSSPQNVQAKPLPKNGRVESIVVGSDGEMVWLAGEALSCWQ